MIGRLLFILLILLSYNIQANSKFEWRPQSVTKEIDCLAKNLYFETRNQSLKGMIAVGLVTINRTKSELFPNTVCDVVWQRNRDYRTRKLVAQFSWTLDGKSDNPQEHEKWILSQQIAEAFLAEGSLGVFVDFTNGATHYHANYVDPQWNTLVYVTTIGDHIFYKQPVEKSI